MRARIDEIEALDAEVLVISFAPANKLDRYRNDLKLPFPIGSDPGGKAYADYGLGKGSRWKIWHPRTLLKYLGYALKGKKIKRPKKDDDLSQLGGDFVIDAQGRVLLAHASERPDDRPSVDTLIAALQDTR